MNDHSKTCFKIIPTAYMIRMISDQGFVRSIEEYYERDGTLVAKIEIIASVDCAGCGERYNYAVTGRVIEPGGKCPTCTRTSCKNEKDS